MTTLAHISDLHFGTEIPAITDCLRQDLLHLNPTLVVVSGDFTQRARRSQFASAQHFLETLPFPKMLVPGNHDVPLYDVLRRFLAPLKRYHRFIHPEANPFYHVGDLAVLGINTARSFTWINGRISYEQMDLIREKLGGIPPDAFKIVVTHHPFIPPPGEEHAAVKLVGRARHALKVLDECGVDMLLAGHLHHGYTGDVRTYYPATRRSIIVVQAGTATSRRLRREPNAYNAIMLAKDQITVSVRQWVNAAFTETARVGYQLVEEEWRPVETRTPLPRE